MEDLDLPLRKKKKSKPIVWDAERDAEYDFCLRRVAHLMPQKVPTTRTVALPSPVLAVNKKHTAFINFRELTAIIGCSSSFILSYVLAELGTTATVKENGTLILKGRYKLRVLEAIIKNFVKTYVICHYCHSFNTTLHKGRTKWLKDEDSLKYSVKCEECHTSRWFTSSL
jgi:translation initiation factor 2 subunit 2